LRGICACHDNTTCCFDDIRTITVLLGKKYTDNRCTETGRHELILIIKQSITKEEIRCRDDISVGGFDGSGETTKLHRKEQIFYLKNSDNQKEESGKLLRLRRFTLPQL